jgi:hypothetical protein
MFQVQGSEIYNIMQLYTFIDLGQFEMFQVKNCYYPHFKYNDYKFLLYVPEYKTAFL